ncbi:Acetate/butyrate--CoA ligase AAE7, peroxisomal [Hibiscus syriacus]|uniref:Acetate/butyrate--CoA ligase AAE7, peroxisomal n=1 Tax=Hibiscus syriacus TaxID=106335 RepID=A0A6A2YWS8_HIBSY|nr:Acetate/butyrate--CoA ligase AAE7, peroxisomal [Hibiscus syriacus]
MSGDVINPVYIRLNAATIAFLLDHSQSAIVIVNQEFFNLAEDALKLMKTKSQGEFKSPLVIVVADESCDPKTLRYALGQGAIEHEKFLESGDPDFGWKPPRDEWQSIALGYTSSTTASPKGVVLHHRGAYLMALSNPVIWGMNEGAVYLCTLPMFHCNGWCFSLTLAAVCGTNICLRQLVIDVLIRLHRITIAVNAPPEDTILPLPHLVHVMTAGAAPPPSTLATMSQKAFLVTHTYGLSETYGPYTVCAWKPQWDSLPPERQALLNARQGVRYVGLKGQDVIGYLKNLKANEETFANGWFHSGDLGVKHPGGYIEVKDRSKDIIISGGENISTVEVENILCSHPAVLEVSVVAKADERWGESPCAFVTL